MLILVRQLILARWSAGAGDLGPWSRTELADSQRCHQDPAMRQCSTNTYCVATVICRTLERRLGPVFAKHGMEFKCEMVDTVTHLKLSMAWFCSTFYIASHGVLAFLGEELAPAYAPCSHAQGSIP